MEIETYRQKGRQNDRGTTIPLTIAIAADELEFGWRLPFGRFPFVAMPLPVSSRQKRHPRRRQPLSGAEVEPDERRQLLRRRLTSCAPKGLAIARRTKGF